MGRINISLEFMKYFEQVLAKLISIIYGMRYRTQIILNYHPALHCYEWCCTTTGVDCRALQLHLHGKNRLRRCMY